MRKLLYQKFFGKLKNRLLIIILAGLVLLSLSYYFYIIQIQRSLFNESFQKSTTQTLETIKLGIEVGLSNENYESINEVFSWARRDTEIKFIVLTEGGDEILSSYPENRNFDIGVLTDQSRNARLTDSVIVKFGEWKAPIGYGRIFIGFTTKTIRDYENKVVKDLTLFNLLLLFATAGLILLLTSGITRPIEKLISVSDKISSGEYGERMDERRGGIEIETMAKTFNRMVKTITDSKKKMESDIQEAVGFVRRLLPEPIKEPINVEWLFMPSEHLGGDTFGYHKLSDGKWAVYLIDVSGHGAGAALYSVSVYNIIREESLPNADFGNPAEVLSSLNKIFLIDRYGDKYFTIWYGVIDIEKRILKFSSAGHPPALMIYNNRISELDEGDVFIGAFSETNYKNKSVDIHFNSDIYIYSDGLIELRKASGKILLFDEFKNLLLEFDDAGKPLDELIKKLTAIKSSPEFEDDVSIIKISI